MLWILGTETLLEHAVKNNKTGIDILMLQDSGEHLAFFTIEQREPFFNSVAKACHNAGAQFWVNVETGEADVKKLII